MGGLDLRDLSVEQGIAQVMEFMEQVHHKTETGRLIQISLSTLQMEAGTSGPILLDTSAALEYTTKCWIGSLREFLRKHQIQIQIQHLWNFTLPRQKDLFIMDQFRCSGGFSVAELVNLNAVRIYLQVATLSDIATADGKSIDEYSFRAERSPYRKSNLSWIRQPVITSAQQSLWSAALCKIFLSQGGGPRDDGARRLSAPLGQWTGVSHQRWKYYYHPLSQALIAPISEYHARAYPRVPATSRNKLSFSLVFRITSVHIEDYIPVDNVERYPEKGTHTAQTDLRHSHNGSSVQEVFVGDYKQYIRALPKERQRFFAWSKPYGESTISEVIRQVETAIKDKRPIELAPDGGLADSKGAFGVIMALGNIELWEMAGPVDGDPATANSKRAELAGYAASLELLFMLTSWIQMSSIDTLYTQIWIDSSGAGRHLSNLLKTSHRKRRYPHDPDLISHIQWLWRCMPKVQHTIRWVKGHQDSNRPYHDLPRNAQLNVLADKLATAFAKGTLTKKCPSRANPMFFPASEVSLIINGQRNTAYPRESMRFHINGTRMRQYLQKARPHWQDKVWNSIDIQGLGLAYKTLQHNRRFRICKSIHGWLPTGHQRHKHDLKSLDSCPCCSSTDETQEHILVCRAPRMRAARYRAMVKLRSNIVTKKGSSYTWTALHRCLVHWVETSQSLPWEKALAGIPQQAAETIQRAMRDQEDIGWQFAFRGYLSVQWVQAQQGEHSRSTETGIRQKWLKAVIRAIWDVTSALWEERNNILHSTSDNVQIRDSSVNSKIRKLYSIKELFASSDFVLFDEPLEERLLHTLREKKQWLTLVARYHGTTTARQFGKQHLITEYFKVRSGRDKRMNSAHLEDPPNIKTHVDSGGNPVNRYKT